MAAEMTKRKNKWPVLFGRSLVASLALIFSAVSPSMGQTVAIEGSLGEEGFGWMFRQGGTCYAILPDHVAGPLPRITVTTGAPVAVGTGNVIRPFWEGIDLALAVVHGGATARCVAKLEDLTPTRNSRATGRLLLHRLTGSGEDDWINLQVSERGYLTIDAQVTDPDKEIYQGTSGAFAFDGDVPVGMATTSKGTKHVELMRSEEIALNVGRFLSEQSLAFVQDTSPKPAITEAAIPLIVDKVTAKPISPRQGPDNLLGDGSYIFEPVPSAEILLRVEGDVAVALSQVVIKSDPEAGFATPRRVLISTDQGINGARLRPWFRGEVGPDGQLDTGPRAVRDVRWIQILVLSAWGNGPIEISNVFAR